jgi:hypothetical protein
MKLSIEKTGGIALLTGALLTVFTAVLHPEGGSIQYLQSMAPMIAVSHSAGLLAIPFLGLGFWVLTKRIGAGSFLPLLSFAFTITGLSAGMMAATINGLALPLYVLNYKEATAEITAIIRPVIRYNVVLNQAFDYVFLGALSFAILCWAFSILYLGKLPKWIGYIGLIFSITVIVLFLTGYVFVNLHGFRLFLFFLVVWIGLVGVALLRSDADGLTNRISHNYL